MAIITPKENSGILCAEWLDEHYVNLSDLSVQQNDESDTMPVVTIDEHLTFPWEDDSC